VSIVQIHEARANLHTGWRTDIGNYRESDMLNEERRFVIVGECCAFIPPLSTWSEIENE
jgi:hypothetical protein